MNDGRYARQTILPEIGEAGQAKIASSSVLIVGAGGLGSPAALYLAAAGIGHISIADGDEVRLHNLNRQILYNDSDIGMPKADKAKSNLGKFNRGVDVSPIGRIDGSNVSDILSDRKYDLVIDATDNFETRYILNEACADKGLVLIYGSVLGWKGQVSVFDAKKGPCYQCIYPEPPSEDDSPTCYRSGVIGVAPGIVGVLQATEAIKLIVMGQSSMIGRLLLVDLLSLDFRLVEISKDPRCKICGGEKR